MRNTILRTIAGILLIVSLLSTAACSSNLQNPSGEADVSSVVSTARETDALPEKANDSVVFDLDTQYESEIQNAISTAEMVEVNTRYADLWEERMHTYYQRILDFYEHDYTDSAYADYIEFYDVDPVQIQASAMQVQQNWEAYYQSEMDYYLSHLQSVYGPGTIIPIVQSDHRYQLIRARAVDLYEQCRTIGFDPDAAE